MLNKSFISSFVSFTILPFSPYLTLPYSFYVTHFTLLTLPYSLYLTHFTLFTLPYFILLILPYLLNITQAAIVR